MSKVAETKQPTTKAAVYQSNSHANDDTYQVNPTSDNANTLSYDHAKGGQATHFYIRQYNDDFSEVENGTIQMYANPSNSTDFAFYHNVRLTHYWKIYDTDTGSFYGYEQIEDTNPIKPRCTYDNTYKNIKLPTGEYFDIYLNDHGTIWIAAHNEETTSDQIGNRTGYYIYGNTVDNNSALSGHDSIRDGIPMYVNAAATNNSVKDRAYYAGLRLSSGDVFYLASGDDSTGIIKAKDANKDNLAGQPAYFSFNTTTGAITCNQLGYYCVAVTGKTDGGSIGEVFITEWDGKEVDGTTRYTVDTPNPNPQNIKPFTGPSVRKSISGWGNYWKYGDVYVKVPFSYSVWGGPYLYAFQNDSIKNANWPGAKMTYHGCTSDGSTVWKTNFSNSDGFNTIIINNGSSAWQTGNISLPSGGSGDFSGRNEDCITLNSNTKGSQTSGTWAAHPTSGLFDYGLAGSSSTTGSTLNGENFNTWHVLSSLAGNKGQIANVVLKANDTFKIVNASLNKWYDAQSDMAGGDTSTYVEDGGGDDHNFKVLRSGVYNIGLNSESKVYVNLVNYETYTMTKTPKIYANGVYSSDGTPTTQNVTYGSASTSVTNDLVVANATFEGWYSDAACSANNKLSSNSTFTYTTAISGDVQIYAKYNMQVWNISFYLVLLDASGTIESTTEQTGLAMQVVRGNTYGSLPGVPSVTSHYTRVDTSWHISGTSSSSATVTASSKPTADTNLYCYQQKCTRYNITYYTVTDGGSPVQTGDVQQAYTDETYTTYALPAVDNFVYEISGWYSSAACTGATTTPNVSHAAPSSNTNYYAKITTRGTKTFYVDVYDVAALQSDPKINVWIQNGPSNPSYALQKVNNSYNYWWKATVPYVEGSTRFQLYTGTNYQSSQFTVTSTDGNILKVTGYTQGTGGNGTCTANWLNVSSSGDVRTVSLFASYDRDGIITDETPARQTYPILSGETWTLSAGVVSSVYSNETGFTTPVSFHLGSNSGATTYSSGDSFAVTSNVSLYGVYVRQQYTFRVRQSIDINGNDYGTGDIGTVSYHCESGATQTLSNIHLEQGKIWYIDDNTESGGGQAYVGHILFDNMSLTDDSINIAAHGISTTADKDNYFVKQDNNIRTKFGGRYNITINFVTKRITAITLTSFDLDDVKILGNGGAFPDGDTDSILDFDANDGFTATSVSGSSTTLTFNYGSKSFYIADKFKAAHLYTSGSNYHTYAHTFTGTNASTYFYNDTNDNNNIRSRVHITCTVSVALDVTTGALGTITLGGATETNCNNIKFTHAEDAGIYIEVSSNADFAEEHILSKSMMHTTSTSGLQALEAPVYFSAGQYFRIIKAHSYTGSETLTASNIRENTEYYYVSQGGSPNASFNSTTNQSSTTGNGKNAYITVGNGVSSSMAWNVSLDDSGTVHISTYTGYSSRAEEHQVPYYLIGRGMPGSALRDSDFTIGGGIMLWTYGGNASTVPCYVGEIGNNTSSSNVEGAGISLKKGDRFAISNSNSVLTGFAANSGTGFSVSSNIVTISISGTYKIYLSGEIGAETINIAKTQDPASDWTRGNDDLVAGGVNLVATSGNTLTFSGNLDYSLLDAMDDGGYSFVVELSHASAATGTMTYHITNGNSGNSGYSISVAKASGSYSNPGEYGSPVSIAGGADNSSLSTSITGGTPATVCLKVTISPEEIASLLKAGTLTFSMTIDCIFTEVI